MCAATADCRSSAHTLSRYIWQERATTRVALLYTVAVPTLRVALL
jgi:hypothetical protein